MTEKHRVPVSISVPCCGYCDKFHNDFELLPDRERTCGKGYKVWMLSNMCGAYHQQTRYNCPHEKGKEVTSIQCINNRMIGFPHCMGCEVFLGEKAEPRIKPKKIVKHKPILKKWDKEEHPKEVNKLRKKAITKEATGVSIHDILKKKGGE